MKNSKCVLIKKMLENNEIEESVLKGAYQGYSCTIFWNLLDLSLCVFSLIIICICLHVVCYLVAQLCPLLCNSMGCSLPVSSAHGMS